MLLSVLTGWLPDANAQGTAFSYQGQLANNGSPANGSYDLQFTLFTTNATGVAVFGPVTNSATTVSNGLFTTTIDFGAGVFNGTTYWLEIAVSTNGANSFSTLAPRQPISPTPYAIYSTAAGSANIAATAASANSVSAANISGALALGQLPPAVVTNGASGVNVSGVFSGNAGGLTNIAVSSVGPPGLFNYGVSFFPDGSFGVGKSPYSVAVADFNKDGRLDLVSGNHDDASLTVLTNAGNGVFGTAATIGLPSQNFDAVQVIAADVNGDNLPDIVTLCMGGPTDYYGFEVLTNNGAGGFVFACRTQALPHQSNMVLANLFGNGRLDAVVCNQNQLLAYPNPAWGVQFYKNLGNGNFTPDGTLVTSLSPPECVAVADVNGDGFMDIIVADGGNQITVLTNNGTGQYTMASRINAGNLSQFIATADINGDGKVDLITADRGGGGGHTLTVLTNNGSGGFSIDTVLQTDTSPSGVVAADLDGNGTIDLIASCSVANKVDYFLNDGQGNFTKSPVVNDSGYPLGITMIDVLNNGKPGFVTANSDANGLMVFTNFTTVTVAGPLNVAGANGNNEFMGNGGGLTNLNPAQLAGIVPITDLPSNLVTNAQTGITLGGTFSGNGGGLTNLNPAQLAGIVPITDLPSNLVTNTQNGITLGGTFSGNGGGLTNLNAWTLGGNQMTTNGSGIVLGTNLNAAFHPIYLKGVGDINQGLASSGAATNFNMFSPPDGPMLWGYAGGILGVMNPSISVALTWTATGVGIGTTSPATKLHVVSSGDTEVSIQSSDAGNHRWTLQSSGSGTPGLTGTFQIIDRTTSASRMTVYTDGNILMPGNVTNAGLVVANGGVRIGGNPAAVGVESLRTLRGQIAGGGSVDFGSGFTANHNGPGDYTITFSTSFGGTPAVTLTPYGSLVIGTLYITSASSVEVRFSTPTGTAADPIGFDFIAVGP